MLPSVQGAQMPSARSLQQENQNLLKHAHPEQIDLCGHSQQNTTQRMHTSKSIIFTNLTTLCCHVYQTRKQTELAVHDGHECQQPV